MSLLAIVGRPNVGKSTLFNRLVGMRQAIVDETAGVTRDRHYGRCEWCGTEFSVVDTGGYTSNSDDIFEEMLPEIENYPPPAWKGKYIKIKYITQLPTRSPSFAFFCNLPQYIREPYRRFLENKLRSKFDFLGCPVHIFLRQK